MTTAYITHAHCILHNMGADHPESPLRLHAIEDYLIANGLMDFLHYEEAPRATFKQLARVHDEAYIARILAFKECPDRVYLDPDTLIMQHSPEAALRAAGAVVMAVNRVLDGKVRNAFCNVRPPGHHALCNETMGFCFFNNVAVGVTQALVHDRRLKRVAVCDFDVHHGNGTEAMFTADEKVMLCSSFQHPFFPYSEFATDHPRMINCPLPAGTRSEAFRDTITQRWLPALHEFQPQLLMISAGFDAHREDDMSHVFLNDQDYLWITRELMKIADEYAGGKIVSVLEGGYHLPSLARCAGLHIKALLRMD